VPEGAREEAPQPAFTDGRVEARDVSLESIEAAAARIAGRIRRTPLLSSRTAAREIEARTGVRLGSGHPVEPADGDDDPGPRLFLKAEHLQATGSYKPRGATNRISLLSPEERRAGVITISAGNHAQAVAYAASAQGVRSTVVMPSGASRSKAAAAAGYGAHVVLHGSHVGEALAWMEELRRASGAFFLHPFDDREVIVGQGTVGLEIVEALPDVDVVVAGVGGGGLIGGLGAALRRLRPSVRVYGVEPEGSDALSRALAAGHPVQIEPHSIADGLGAPFAGAWTIELARRYVEAVVLVDEVTIARGLRFALERMKQLLEPAGAAALGALLAGGIPIREGEVVCAVASGGNVDLTRLPELLALAGPAES
jgi:threonine dehydratase